jgi:hypothetical protein
MPVSRLAQLQENRHTLCRRAKKFGCIRNDRIRKAAPACNKAPKPRHKVCECERLPPLRWGNGHRVGYARIAPPAY